MLIQNEKFKVYVIGHKDMNDTNINYTRNILNENDFNLCESIESADFILDTKEFSDTYDAIFSLEYANRDYIEVAETLFDLLRFRNEAQFIECEIN